jgi:hypothetical protein
VILASSAYGACTARSASGTAALVELYTAQTCSGCPAAASRLASLAKRYPPDQVVPIVLHVDYGDYIDSSVRRRIWERERRLSPRQRTALVYTPQVHVQGIDFYHWATPQFERAVEQINARPAQAQLSLEVVRLQPDALQVHVSAQVTAARPQAVLYVAATGGKMLVVEWKGPYAMGSHELALPLPPKAHPGTSGAAAFVLDRRSGEVLQALARGACVP